MNNKFLRMALAAVIAVAALVIYNLHSNQGTAQANGETNYKNEPSGTGPSLAMAIYGAYKFTHDHVEHPNTLNPKVVNQIISDDKEALQIAKRKQVSANIIDQLNHAVKLSEQSAANLDSSVLIKANQLLTQLNHDYNAGNPKIEGK